MICPGTKRPPPIASELESVPAEAEGGRGTRGGEYFGIAGEPAALPPEPSLGATGTRGAAEGVRPCVPGESSVTPSLMSGALSSVAASLKSGSSVCPIPIGSSLKRVLSRSTSEAVEAPHDEQKRAFGERGLPQDEQNMERRFYQPNPRKTTP